jgi:hypothetical protein
MATRPDSVPLDEPITSHMTCLVRSDSSARMVNVAESVPAAAASVVVMAASAATGPTPMMASAEPGLKPYLHTCQAA